jgi:hypothetical protein
MPPLWMPEGSGRLLLALSIVGTINFLAVASLVYGLDIPPNDPILLWLLTTASVIIGFYFGVRSQQKKNGAGPPTNISNSTEPPS